MKTSKIVIAGTAALAASGVLGVTPPAVQASSAQPATWTQQHPATRPPARYDASMAYDAATRTAVLFGGQVGDISFLSDTWTWHGTTWTQRHPAVHPGARGSAAMAYDATTRTVVLFSGFHRGHRGGSVTAGTWTWNGTTWTRQHPAASPAARFGAAVAYDAATGSVVLFGGAVGFGGRWGNDTWTWNGTTWTQQHPATSPPARAFASMAYDAATGTAVLFGGFGSPGPLADTWTWDGTTWTQQHPATSPPARDGASMAYDTATSTAVLFGGYNVNGPGPLADTWTWDGTTWTQQHPATSPPARCCASMAYDTATSSAVLFGGAGPHGNLGGTWTWG